VDAQLRLERRADHSRVNEANEALGEGRFLGPGGQPDGQPPGSDMVDDAAAAVSCRDAVGDETLVQGEVGDRPVLGQPVRGSCRRAHAVIGLWGLHLTGVDLRPTLQNPQVRRGFGPAAPTLAAGR